MGNRHRTEFKKHEANNQNFVSKTRKPCCSKTRRSLVDRVLFLQRTIGNQAVQRLMKSGRLQAKLRIGAPGDVYEREADRVADAVIRMPQPQAVSSGTPSIQRACPKCEQEELKRQPIKEEDEEKKLQRKPEEEKVEEIQAKATSGSISEVNPDIESVIQSFKGGGQSLSENERAFFEPRFGHGFSQVRLHSGGAAEQSARDVNAKAFTVGHNIVFGAGQLSPGTQKGRHLLAHELTHVVQQSSSDGIHVGQNYVKSGLSSMAIHPMIQRDLAIEPPRPAAVGRALTPAQMATAITFNNRVLGSIANSADIIEMIRDVIGISPLPAVVDEDFVNGVVQWQANFGLTQDGQLGPATARPLFREIGAEGVGRGEVSRPPRYTPAGPINVARAGPRRTRFDMSAEFRSDPRNGIFPSCCEVRQDIQWDAAFVAAAAAAGNPVVPHAGFPAAHPAGRWIEDRNEADTLRYGHRAEFDRGPGNQYLNPAGRQNQAFGHRFEGNDNPEGLAADRGSWNFRLRVIDVCNGNRQLAVSPTLVLNWL